MNSSKWYIIFISLTAACGGFLFGFDTALISGALSPLIRYFNLESNPVLQGWIVSSVVLGSVLGAIISGYLADRFGRKNALLLTGFLFLLSAAGAALSYSFVVFIVFRLICGLAVGIAAMVSPLYLAELSPAHIRGRMIALNQLTLTIGILMAYCSNLLIQQWLESNEEVAWRWMLGVASLPSLLFLGLLLRVPESPRYLALQPGKAAAAQIILEKLVGKSEAEMEMERIRSVQLEKPLPMRCLLKPAFRNATWMALFLSIVSQLSGIDLVLHYGPVILERTGMSLGDALGSQMVYGVILVLFTSIAMWKIDTLGRRSLLLIGNLGIFISLILIGYFLSPAGYTETGLLIAISCFVASFALSLGPAPWIIMAELFPSSIRGQAMALATFVLFGTNWLVAQLFPLSAHELGEHTTFWILAACALPTFWFTWKVLPETKGKLLDDSLN